MSNMHFFAICSILFAGEFWIVSFVCVYVFLSSFKIFQVFYLIFSVLKNTTNAICLSFKYHLNIATVGLSSAIFWPQRSGCTVLVTVPLTPAPNNPYHQYFRAIIFPDLNSKITSNQDRYNRNLHQGNFHIFQIISIWYR